MIESSRPPSRALLSTLREFIQLESAGGLLLLAAAGIALLVANSPLVSLYDLFLDLPVGVRVGELEIEKPLLLWVNDGLMAIFFFLVGLEIKREVLEGELSSISQIVLPGLGALGGMVVPAAIYAALNWDDPRSLGGWAIPVATDIAFALALLGVFGSRVPTALKLFLLTLAIFDDLAAIVIIALFYSGDLSLAELGIAGLAFAAAVASNRLGVTRVAAYVLIGVVLWVALLKSGVHATLAGVLIAFCVPMRAEGGRSPLKELEHDLHGPVAFAILPFFAFANAGLSLAGMSIRDVTDSVTLGVILGLWLGKPLGVLSFVAIGCALGIARTPAGVTWGQIFGVSCICGIGFTMSLFIAGLAFDPAVSEVFGKDRLGIVIGSLLSAAAGYAVLHLSLPRGDDAAPQG